MSPIRAAGRPFTNTVAEPWTIMSGGPTQTHLSVMRACGMLPVRTFEEPDTIGPPTWGTTPVTAGQVCMSLIRAAGLPKWHPLAQGKNSAER
jgi:hypothetical protein